MAARDLSKTDPRLLRRIWAQHEDARPDWGADELDQIWLHQLRAPLPPPADPGGPGVAASQPKGAAEASGLATYGELLAHPHPPLDALRDAKEYAKRGMNHPDAGLLPLEVAAALYFACIAAARARCGQRITALDDDAVRHGIEWSAQQAWVDPASAARLRRDLAAIAS